MGQLLYFIDKTNLNIIELEFFKLRLSAGGGRPQENIFVPRHVAGANLGKEMKILTYFLYLGLRYIYAANDLKTECFSQIDRYTLYEFDESEFNSQNSAIRKCEANDSTLARISSQSEYDVVINMLEGISINKFFIGLDSDDRIPGRPSDFEFTDGKREGLAEFVHTQRGEFPWAEGKPDNDIFEQCVQWDTGRSDRWINGKCFSSDAEGFLCRGNCNQTSEPNPNPTTPEPTSNPTTPESTLPPILSPTLNPSKAPSESPTTAPSKSPSISPISSPSINPSVSPTQNPTLSPILPTFMPTNSPTEETESVFAVNSILDKTIISILIAAFPLLLLILFVLFRDKRNLKLVKIKDVKSREILADLLSEDGVAEDDGLESSSNNYDLLSFKSIGEEQHSL